MQTRSGLRVVPDLLADHLVRKACYTADGRRTPLAGDIQRIIAPAFSCDTGLHVIRNLAEAEGQQGDRDGALVEPFWKSFRKKFGNADFFKRKALIGAWARFGVWQPKRSLELARLAIDTVDAPPAENLGADIASVFGIASVHKDVLAAVPSLLAPIAIYQPNFRSEALGLLWQLFRNEARCDEKNPTGALGAIGHVASFDKHLQFDASAVVLSWLNTLVRNADNARPLLNERTPVLSVVLKPIFEYTAESTEVRGMTFSLVERTIPASSTHQLRTDALALIGDWVLPAGEIAVLNVLSVLEAAISPPRQDWTQTPPGDWVNSWLPYRRAALALLEKALSLQPTPRVAFYVRKILRSLSVSANRDVLQPEFSRVLGAIPESAELRLTRILLSNRWSEFVNHLPIGERKALVEKDRALDLWNELADNVASRLAKALPSSTALYTEIERIDTEYSAVGEQPEFGELFAAFARTAPDLSLAVLDILTCRPKTAYDRSMFRLVPENCRLPEPSMLCRVQSILSFPNPVRWQALLNWLSWRGSGEIGPELVDLVSTWAHRINDDSFPHVVGHFSWPNPRTAKLDETILDRLSLAALSGESLDILCQTLGHRAQLEDASHLSIEFVNRLIDELHRIDDLARHHEPSIIPVLARLAPRRFYAMLERRIREAQTSHQRSSNYRPFPFADVIALDGLVNESDYQDLARALLHEMRAAASTEEATPWITLFQWAVLHISPLGLKLLCEWLPETKTASELHRLIQCLGYDGSVRIFDDTDLVANILMQARRIAPMDFEHLRNVLMATASASIRDGRTPDPASRYYRDEAAKAAVVHASDPELAAFYREIVRREDAEAAFLRRQSAADEEEWRYDR